MDSTPSNITIVATSAGSYQHHIHDLTVTQPSIGSILFRTDRHSNHVDIYVVTKVFCRKKGKNAGLVDTIMLKPVTIIVGTIVTYRETKYPMILTLTNHGAWWTKRLLDRYHYCWDKLDSIISDEKIGVRSTLPEGPHSWEPRPVPTIAHLDLIHDSSIIESRRRRLSEDLARSPILPTLPPINTAVEGGVFSLDIDIVDSNI